MIFFNKVFYVVVKYNIYFMFFFNFFIKIIICNCVYIFMVNVMCIESSWCCMCNFRSCNEFCWFFFFFCLFKNCFYFCFIIINCNCSIICFNFCWYSCCCWCRVCNIFMFIFWVCFLCFYKMFIKFCRFYFKGFWIIFYIMVSCYIWRIYIIFN